MTDIGMTDQAMTLKPTDHAKSAARLRRRHAADKRFRYYGIAAIGLAVLAIITLFTSIVGTGYSAFWETTVALDIYFDPEVLDPDGTRDPEVIRKANYATLVSHALYSRFPEVEGRADKRTLRGIVSDGARYTLQDMVMENPSLIGTTQHVTLSASGEVDAFAKGSISPDLPEAERPIKDNEIAWLESLEQAGDLDWRIDWAFFTSPDSRSPVLAGIGGAVMGSFYMLLVTLALSFPIGVATAVYLEEFAPKNRWTDTIEVNINNLAAVPSIVFGLLGLAVFLNTLGMPRSAPVVGGLTLTLMTLPTMIIATRAALRAVPPSIRDAALGVGASPLQAVMHHVLPLAMPGILTGTIIGMAQALGETAPLLMIGMVAFVGDIPGGPFDSATALPVQIFLWADLPERAFEEKTAGAILVLLAFLILMNAVAVYLRRRLERRW